MTMSSRTHPSAKTLRSRKRFMLKDSGMSASHPTIGHSGAATRIPKLAIADNGFDRTLTDWVASGWRLLSDESGDSWSAPF